LEKAELVHIRHLIFPLLFVGAICISSAQEDLNQARYSVALEQAYALVDSLPGEALVLFQAAHRIRPSDTLALQIAYLLNGLNRNEEASTVFGSLTDSRNPEFRERARSAVIILDDMRRANRTPLWARTSTAALYDSRFKDGILWLTLQGGWHLNTARSLSATLTLGIDADTRSDGSLIMPEIYADNYILLAPGLRYVPFEGMAIDLQAGIAYNTKLWDGRPRTQGDVRAVLSYGTGIYPIPAVTESMRFSGSFFADAGGFVGYYSRYTNTISYIQGRGGVRCVEWGATALDLYARLDVAQDSKREFYNNSVEGGLGIRIIPNHAWSIFVMLEAKRGLYVGNSRVDSPYGSAYGTQRLILVWERPF
jgi:hypothetical protein